MAIPFKPKGAGSPAGPETKAVDAMAGEETGEPMDAEPMSLAEAGAMAVRAQKAGDGEAFAEAVLKIVAAGGAP